MLQKLWWNKSVGVVYSSIEGKKVPLVRFCYKTYGVMLVES